MKQLFSLSVLVLAFAACTKIKVERKEASVSAPMSVLDNSSIIVGHQLNMVYSSVNTLLSISSTGNDSLKFPIPIDGVENAIEILVRRQDEPLYDTILKDGTSEGIYYVVNDTDIRMGEHCSSGFLRYDFKDTLNFSTLCSPGYTSSTNYYPNNLLPGKAQYIYHHLYNRQASTGGIFYYKWDSNRFSEGYLSFRYAKNGVIKYGWIHLDIQSATTMRVIAYAYQK